MSMVSDDRDLRAEVEQLLFLEARLADESRYEEWLALMTDDVRVLGAVGTRPTTTPTPGSRSSTTTAAGSRHACANSSPVCATRRPRRLRCAA